MYRLGKIANKYNRELTNGDYQKCKKDTIVFEGTECISKMSEWLVTPKGEPKKVEIKIVDCELQLIAENGSASVTYVVSNSSSNWDSLINILKNGKGIVSSKTS